MEELIEKRAVLDGRRIKLVIGEDGRLTDPISESYLRYLEKLLALNAQDIERRRKEFVRLRVDPNWEGFVI